MRLSIFSIALCLCLSGCVSITWNPSKKADDLLTLQAASFGQLPGWDADHPAEALAPLKKSCDRIGKKDPEADFGIGGFAGSAAAWQEVCGKLQALKETDARAFFEENFTPYAVFGNKGRDGLFTGYYEPVLRGSLKKGGAYRFPLYGRPNDLVEVNLGDFKPALKGETIMGRVQDKALVPYYKRAEIEEGALKKRRRRVAREIVWVDSAVDAFFLHIQGSGQVRLRNGKVVRVGYASENGQPYTAIGRELIKRGALTKDDVSMQSIRDWLEKNPDQAEDVMNLNTSYIFFDTRKNADGPLGAEGVPLTPRRSMAVDRKKIPYGVPLWLDAEDPDSADPARELSSADPARIQKLMVAQDTGGAITGAVRGDFFWGAGDEAAHKAGLMKSPGHLWLLLPKAVVVPPEKLRKPWRRIFEIFR